MKRNILALAAATLAACTVAATDPATQADAATPKAGVKSDGRNPVVVELFQSQGCSSCPPANANVNAIAASQPEVLALSYAVTYWDYLGWKDKFAKPEFTARQRDYAKAKSSDGVYTPQVVVNGRSALVGANRGVLNRAIAAGGRLSGGPSIERDGKALVIGAGRAAAPAQVLIITYDPRVRQVPIKAGENNGRTLPHRNIVTDLDEAGTWTGKPLRIALTTPSDPALRTAVLLQQGTGGPIVAARKF